jgi:S1-C subfamily serine protease
VREVSEGSAAEVSGIKKGDIILSINGRKVNSVPELQESVGRFRPGEKVKTLILRGTNKMEISLTLKSVNGSTKLASAIPEVRIPELGVTLSIADPEMLKKAGIQNGLKIESLENGPLEAAGLEEGFTLFKLDKQTFSTVVEFERIYKRGKGGMLLEALNPEGSREYFVLLKPVSR